MRYCFDIDGTICTPTKGRDYESAQPFKSRIDTINKLYNEAKIKEKQSKYLKKIIKIIEKLQNARINLHERKEKEESKE